MQIYMVGGAVRDGLLHRQVQERDWVVVGATAEQMLALGYKQIGKDFPVFLHPETKEEYALARTEKKSGAGYKGFTVHAAPEISLEEDLRRRDLTINAMAMTKEGKIIDPFGGLADLEHKILRHVSPAFIEDPLRVLRLARFAARYHHLGFTIAPETLTLMQEISASGELSHLVAERVWQELFRALQEDKPSVFIQTLRDSHALQIIFPELDKLYGVPNPAKWHPEIDTGIHTCMVVDAAAQLSTDPAIRFAALVHDLGKGLTHQQYWPSHHGHEEKGVGLIQALSKRLKISSDMTDLAILTSRYHGRVHRIFEAKASTVIELLEKLDVFRRPERFEKFLLACKADFLGRTHFEKEPYPQLIYLQQAHELANEVKTDLLIKQGFSGKQLAEQLHLARVQAIYHLKG